MGQNRTLPILIIDDEATVADFVAQILQKEGYSTLIADSGYAGLALVAERFEKDGNPCIAGIICDWKMPGWDGVKVLEELRQGPYHHVKFILMSGVVSPEELQRAADDADTILIKPIDPEVLINKVQKTFFRED